MVHKIKKNAARKKFLRHKKKLRYCIKKKFLGSKMIFMRVFAEGLKKG